ncbi:MAG TPA: bifunctional alpha,alpha-trehalose-phosphate synthase (UDP-forming)/trehalose-phosphatase, partial [Deltaproteobacteria bacterium]|nr:bifunctional alpha,alpha-trehalose-phosphate synthase (UDP-forming)/trehalose-phosphatase [Deltaproteobacteria bacterium]
LLGADLIGFHTYDYTHAFTRCLLRYLGLEQSLGYVHTQDRMLKADTFPLGIDFDAFFRGAGSRRVLQHGRKIRQAMGKQKLVLSLDRLDYTKG